MSTSKIPNNAPGQNLGPSTPATPPDLLRRQTDAQDEIPGQSRDSDNLDLIRHAHSAQGLLSQRNPERLRRFILDSADEAEQNRRQTELFEHGTTYLTHWPHSSRSKKSANHPRVVQMGLYAWPLVVCMPEPLRIKNWFTFDEQGSAPLKAELARTWAKALGVPDSDVLIHGAINTHLVAGMAPLTWQGFVQESCQRMSPCSSSRGPTGITSDEGQGNTPSPQTDPWNLLVTSDTPDMMGVGPNQPVAFLLTTFVLWDYQNPQPVVVHPRDNDVYRMQALLQARFMHSRPAPCASVAAETRIPIRPEMRLGHPQPVHHAITQSQWMQLAWMAERARKSDCSFKLTHRQDGTIVGWSAQLTNAEQEVCASVDYCYDGFWRPVEHVRCIAQRVGLAQGTGQMGNVHIDYGVVPLAN